MGSNGGTPMKMSVNEAAQCSEPTVEIKIKTLDSQTFIMRVDKCVPVPELKEQIATVTGVLSEQQRLICRGKVLMDDQLLSAYHVEDGHTLHLVVRQPVAPSSENSSDQPGTDPTSNTEQSPGNRVGPGMVVGTFNISEQGDGAIPDLNRLVSAVLSSFGLARFGSGVDGLDLNQPPSERLSAASGLSGLRNSSSMQSGQAASTDIPVEPLQPPVIPDSMTTLLHYLRHLTQECVAHVGEQNATSQNPGIAGSDGQDQEAAAHSSEARRVLKPEFLAEVVSSTRQLLVGQASDCLSHLARQLNSQASMTDPLVRSVTQSYAMRSGTLFQNIGSLLLELGRAVMTLRMGQSPADALVNAGPSVFVSPTGPNPIMVQPLPFQPGANFGSIPVGSSEHVSGLTGGSVGSGFLPRNIDIRIRTGSVFPRREPTGSQPQEQGAPPASSSSVNSAQQDGMGVNLNSLSRETQVRVIPTRTVVAAVPPSVGRGSDSSRGSIGILYPVLARVQHVTSSNLNGTRAPQTSDQNGGPDVNSGQPIPDSASQPHNGNNNSPDDRGLYTQMQSGLEQFLRTVFTGEHVLGDIPNPTASGFVATEAALDAPTSQEAAAAAAAAAVTDEGIFLSNVLHQIMPIISQNNGDPSTGEDNPSETQDDENSERGTSSRHRRNPQSQQNPKRQRRD